jgi:type IV pilus assembly protein PilB
MPLAPISDVRKAVAILSQDYKLIDTEEAFKLLESDLPDSAIVFKILEEVNESSILKALAKELKIRFFDIYSTTPDFLFSDKVVAKADVQFLSKYSALPMVDKTGKVIIAVANPNDIEMIDYLRMKYPEGFALVLSSRKQIQNKLTYYSASEIKLSPGQQPQQSAKVAAPVFRDVVTTNSPMQDWVEATLAKAVSEGASDVHFMMNPDGSLLLRLRIDGILVQQTVPGGLKPMEAIGAVVSRCSTMDAANYKEPQDGTFSFNVTGRAVDARVALMPQLHGPTLVIRLLDSENMGSKLDDMGFAEDHLHLMRKALDLPQGGIVAVGPTGAGKTTTLWGMLREIDANTKHIQTVENPVEYRLPLIGQTEIRSDLGDRSITFARALRTILRLDPDVVLVGEIRDSETAEVAIQAALTGHLVLSTLHANSAVAAYSRLINMNVPSFLVSEAMDLVISQRLMRKVHECATLDPPTETEALTLSDLGFRAPELVPHIVGCPGCRGVGYRGRLAAAEVLAPNKDFRSAVLRHESSSTLNRIAKDSGLRSISADALRHVRNGESTISELIRVVSTEELD